LAASTTVASISATALSQAKNVALLGRTFYLTRHIRIAAPYLTSRKLENLALNEVERWLARPYPRSLPPYIKIESTPLCHLSCSGCAHKSKAHKRTLHNKMHLNVDRIARIIDPIANDLIGVSLSFSGEPLLNRQLPEIVSYIHHHRIYTSFPTNLSVPLSVVQAESFVRSGLDLMNVSLDGATEETYLQYRVGGRFELVVRNVRELADAKRRLGVRRPILSWKMVVFPHNVHEMERVKRDYLRLGFDQYEFVLDNESVDRDAASAKRQRMVAKREPCFYLWNTATIGWDGTAEPCCQQLHEVTLGNVADDGLRAVWRSEPYAGLRRGFSRKHYGEDMNPVCQRCIGLSSSPS